MNYRGQTTLNDIFLTGATGVLGARLLMEILEATDATVYCLSREQSVEKARELIEKLLYVYDPDKELEGETWRIVPVIGDLEKENLGLEEAVYLELSSCIDLTIHSAANVNLLSSFKKLSPVNVDGTKRIIEFCLNGDVPLLYVSSFCVVGSKLWHDFTMMEDDLDVGQDFTDMGYEKSKFYAEKAVHQATESGLNWAIVRPGNIWGDSETGCYPLFETKVKGIYYEMVKSLVETAYIFPSNENFDISPVDYVAKSTLHVAINIHKTNYATYHLTNPNPITYNDIAGQLVRCGYKIRNIGRDEYLGALCEHRFVRDGKRYSSTYTDLLAFFVDGDDPEELVKYDTKKIETLLKGTNIICPPSDDKYMSSCLEYAIKRDYINSPVNQYPIAEISEEMGCKTFLQGLIDYELEVEELEGV